MDAKGSLLEVARRRVADAEARMREQAARVEQAAIWGQDTVQAKAALAVFEGALRLLQEDLARLETKEAARRQP